MDMFNNLFNDEFFKNFFNGFDFDNQNGEWKEQKIETPDGSYTGYYRVYVTKPQIKEEPLDEFKKLESELKTAVEVEDYLKAAELKKKMDSLKENAEKIDKLRSQLELAVKEEDYIKAAELKKEIESIK